MNPALQRARRASHAERAGKGERGDENQVADRGWSTAGVDGMGPGRGGGLQPCPDGQKGRVILEPSRRVDLGEGLGRRLEAEVSGGVVGVVFDARGRPLVVPQENRSTVVENWAKALNAYPR